jgi:hypothetical protein
MKKRTSVVAMFLASILGGQAHAEVMSFTATRDANNVVVRGNLRASSVTLPAEPVRYTVYQWKALGARSGWKVIKEDKLNARGGVFTITLPQSTAKQRFLLRSGFGRAECTLPAGDPPTPSVTPVGPSPTSVTPASKN